MENRYVIKTDDERTTVITTNKSNLTVGQFRKLVASSLNLKKDIEFRLFYVGKELKDNNLPLKTYNVTPNRPVHALILDPSKILTTPSNQPSTSQPKPSTSSAQVTRTFDKNNGESSVDIYYEVGDYVDFWECYTGSWYQGTIKEIKCVPREAAEADDASDEQQFVVVHLRKQYMEHYLSIDLIRPVSHKILEASILKPSDVVLVNFNPDGQGLGHWYDFIVRTPKTNDTQLSGDLKINSYNRDEVLFYTVPDDAIIYAIEKNKIKSELTADEVELRKNGCPLRPTKVVCSECNDSLKKACLHCGCGHCGFKYGYAEMIICDECEDFFHLRCVKLDEVPDDQWFCVDCVNTDSPKCEPIAQNNVHFGSIVGEEVGASYVGKDELSTSGVHVPLKSSFHFARKKGVASILLDSHNIIDNGLTVIIEGNNACVHNKKRKRHNFKGLIGINRFLVQNGSMHCINDEGGTVKMWREGIPIRLVRSHKIKSKFSPSQGYRYDGLYFVKSYYKEKNAKGCQVWKYKLQRNDPSPPPWTKKGKQRIESLGLTRVLPSGSALEPPASDHSPYSLPNHIVKLIELDTVNKVFWDRLISQAITDKMNLMQKIKEQFTCPCCLDLLDKPAYFSRCLHTFCSSLEISGSSCPVCRANIHGNADSTNKLTDNENLNNILLALFPNYHI
ncbi:E3 ubiquitin-protein ligase UHRF1-like isoform X2 [Cimex lectularius]|uniref:RING-type E3 ubiquitin transferase n=1 Tax=Cimex lectularius TaxID=79782 RepID=A0A8I6RCT2_CIMLE|nr:E3 ubiquitin-protein ligase UHRF1-like isoform X2 [Cimex lectularius]